MKITDLTLIFIAITLPIIIVVYINVSYTIKAEEQEMYYEQLINLAIEDATAEMKQVENDDKNIDYGYSGTEDKKISVNAQVGVKTFFNSLYNNFGIKGNEAAERYLQLFVPALAIIDYNGVYISSIEEYEKTDAKGGTVTIQEHKIKPKKYYTYTYYVTDQKDSDDQLYKVVDATLYEGKIEDGNITSAHTIEFTMDDYVTHRGCLYDKNGNPKENLPEKSFYFEDMNEGTLVEDNVMSTKNNSVLYMGNNDYYEGNDDSPNVDKSKTTDNYKMVEKIVNHLKDVKEKVIIELLTKELAYSVNANNYYAASSGITYDFVFPVIEQETLGEYIDEVGIFAFVQGLSIGNKYLDTQAYSVSRLELVTKYYLTIPNKDGKGKLLSKYDLNLYHSSIKCPEYRNAINKNIIPQYVTTKQQAASVVGLYNKKQEVIGFYPCPICRP